MLSAAQLLTDADWDMRRLVPEEGLSRQLEKGAPCRHRDHQPIERDIDPAPADAAFFLTQHRDPAEQQKEVVACRHIGKIEEQERAFAAAGGRKAER